MFRRTLVAGNKRTHKAFSTGSTSCQSCRNFLLRLFQANSKVQLERELNDARIACGGNGAKTGRTQNRIGIAEWRRVRQIENFSAKFEVARFAETNSFEQREVKVGKTGAAHRIARTAAQSELRRDSKRRRIKPLRGAAL